MTDKQRIADLEDVLAQFLNPIKNLPFPVVIKALAGSEVIPIDRNCSLDSNLITGLAEAAKAVGHSVRSNPIRRSRPNEVGNDIEPHVMAAINVASLEGLKAERPRSAQGRAKQTGYPDLLIYDASARPTYLECKIFGEGGDLTTMRSFYLSPSDDFKVHLDARHLLLAFAVVREPIDGSRDSFYRVTSFKLLDLHGLKCDVKYEFNSDNRRLYAPDLLLAQGEV